MGRRRSMLFHWFLLLVGTADGQAVAEHFGTLGPHAVGFTDTIVWDHRHRYSEYDLAGPLPLFTHVWFPADRATSGNAMRFGELREGPMPEQLRKVRKALTERQDSCIVLYDIRERYPSYDPIDYAPHTERDVLAAVCALPVASVRMPLRRKLDVPVIVYHHGSQGLPEENHAMAEHFASRGYGFVAASFHMPYPDQEFGLEEAVRDDTSSVQAVIRFARSLTTSDTVFYIGHSWGAQVGWCSLGGPDAVRGFVSLETTLEHKTDTNEVKDKWSTMYRVMRRKHSAYTMPVLLLADAPGDGPFAFFAPVRADMVHVSPQRPIGHESFTSSYFLRYLVRDRFPQPDEAGMGEQLALYRQNLVLIEAFLASVRARRPFATEPFEATHRFALVKNP